MQRFTCHCSSALYVFAVETLVLDLMITLTSTQQSFGVCSYLFTNCQEVYGLSLHRDSLDLSHCPFLGLVCMKGLKCPRVGVCAQGAPSRCEQRRGHLQALFTLLAIKPRVCRYCSRAPALQICLQRAAFLFPSSDLSRSLLPGRSWLDTLQLKCFLEV